MLSHALPQSLVVFRPRQEREGEDARAVHNLAQLQGSLGSVQFGNQSQPKAVPGP